MNWDKYFMTMVYFVAMKSKDESSKLGAIIVGPDNEIRSTGYNGFPRGAVDTVLARHERPLKYKWYSHAERNACYNAARCGIALKGCKMYTNGIPCTDCAKAIIQSGIVEVITDKWWNDIEKVDSEEQKIANRMAWDDEAKISLEMFNECGVKHREYDGGLIGRIEIVKSEEHFHVEGDQRWIKE